MRSSFTRGNFPLFTWIVLLLAALAVTVAKTSRQEGWIRSNIFELLPASDYNPLQETATRIVDAELGTRLLFFVGHPDRDVAKRTVGTLGNALSQIPLIESVTTNVDESQIAAMVAFYYPYRTKMLSDAQLQKIASDPDGLMSEALVQLYSPFGAGASLSTDPFFLFPASMQALQPAGSNLQLDDGYLWAARDGLDYVFLMAKVASPTLSIAEQETLARHMNAALDELVGQEPQLDVLKTGFSFYAHEATQSAKGEISTIGVGSLIGLLMLVISTFRSLRPLTLIVASILAGCLIALAVTLSVFGFVHLFTLVFGASLIGVSVDYSFHYIADDAFGGKDWTPRQGISNIFMGITLGLLTSILAYLALTVAPFPGLQQLALFSSAGLFGAYLTLIAMSRMLRRRFVLHERAIVLHFAATILSAWQRSRGRSQLIMLGVIAVVVIAASRSIEVNDDVRVLQSQPAELVAQEAAIQELLGVAQAGTFLLVRAAGEQELLQKEEALRADLDDTIAAGTLGSYQAVSRYVPSLRRQARSQDAYADLVRTYLPMYFEGIGAEPDLIQTTITELTASVSALDIATWLQSPASQQFRQLWLDAGETGSASIVLLFGVQDASALVASVSEIPGVDVVNKGRELSALFGEYRSRVTQMLIAAYLIILAALATRYGLRRATTLLVPPVFAGLLGLVLIALFGETLNLFNFLALILVLGIGIDFTLFIVESRHDLTSTMFAITLSALTTMLSFGLLSLSSTFAVHSFGLTVLIGITFAYLLSPLAIWARVAPDDS